MKIFVYSDCHWSSRSSILSEHGDKYSMRLENLIKSVNWAEKTSKKLGANLVVCCGDFFDKSVLNSEEISALAEVEWNLDAQHWMLVGNHEMWKDGLQISSANIFKMLGFTVVDKPTVELTSFGEICYLPYTENYNLFDSIIEHYNGKRIVFSHNDICGIQMGKFLSKTGFNIEDIEKSCDLFINGHLHNGEQISDKIINIGNITGQNFSEDATKYIHSAILVDTDTFVSTVIENPNAINFYKLDYDRLLKHKEHIKNGVLTVSCKERDIDNCRNVLSSDENILSYKIIVDREKKVNISNNIEKIKSTDHIEQFKEYVISEIGNSDCVKQELMEVCK